MAITADCEGCTVSVHLTPEEIEEILEEATKGEETASDVVYSRRMEICKGCDSFIYGTTCRHNGSIVQVKAKLAGAKCPYPYQSKWEL